MEIKDILAELMRRKGVSASQISRDLKGRISVAGITRILNGETKRPRPSTLKLLADYFGVIPEIFFPGVIVSEAIRYDGIMEYPGRSIPESFDKTIWEAIPGVILEPTYMLFENITVRDLVGERNELKKEDVQEVLKYIYYLYLKRISEESMFKFYFRVKSDALNRKMGELIKKRYGRVPKSITEFSEEERKDLLGSLEGILKEAMDEVFEEDKG
jgi:transcriptional regulator with XRE-family HTH domain